MIHSLEDIPVDDLLLKRRVLRRELMERPHLRPIRFAVLTSATATEVVNILEIGLLASGFLPTFLVSDYGRYYEDAVHDSQALTDFRPDLVYVHTSVRDIAEYPRLHAKPAEMALCLTRNIDRFKEIWQALRTKLGCLVIQNNFEFPEVALLGNLDATSSFGHTRFIAELNRELTLVAETDPKLLIQDLCSIAARVGLDRWFDQKRWFSYKIPITLEASRAISVSLSAIVRAVFGRTRKVLVLDLDNTLWGGVIGDDGPDRLHIGRETALAEAYTSFQEYCLSLRDRGILLAVCSKNSEDIAKQGFYHPDSVLKLEHFSSFLANWEPKHENIARIASELNLTPDSFVFVDDNPAERAIVAAQVEGIAVPDIGDDVTHFAAVIESHRYFEQIAYTDEDMSRAALYTENAVRAEFQKAFSNYDEYLRSLEMCAEISTFKAVYLDRIAQLTNKTNQFNLTTRRFTLAEIETFAADPLYIAIYGRLRDRFGDHGLVSVLVGRKEGASLKLELWLMSCRVLKRGLEQAMLDRIADLATAQGLKTLTGLYLPTSKNKMVADHYANLGFTLNRDSPASQIEGSSAWVLDLENYVHRNRNITVLEN